MATRATSRDRPNCRHRQGFFVEHCPLGLPAPQWLTPFATQRTFTGLLLPRSSVQVHWHMLFCLCPAFPGQLMEGQHIPCSQPGHLQESKWKCLVIDLAALLMVKLDVLPVFKIPDGTPVTLLRLNSICQLPNKNSQISLMIPNLTIFPE